MFKILGLMQERINLTLFKLLLWIFGVNYSYMMLDYHFRTNYEDLNVHLIDHDLGFHDYV